MGWSCFYVQLKYQAPSFDPNVAWHTIRNIYNKALPGSLFKGRSTLQRSCCLAMLASKALLASVDRGCVHTPKLRMAWRPVDECCFCFAGPKANLSTFEAGKLKERKMLNFCFQGFWVRQFSATVQQFAKTNWWFKLVVCMGNTPTACALKERVQFAQARFSPRCRTTGICPSYTRCFAKLCFLKA